MTATVRILVVTYRRPHLLERALHSLREQTFSNWLAEVLNDDPADDRVAAVIANLRDNRIALSSPAVHRGGAGNFNYAFRHWPEPFASILEDDNWWESSFLATMLRQLEKNPSAQLASGNERIWREQQNGEWLDTGRSAWPNRAGVDSLSYHALDKCGGATVCNSSMVFRTENADAWRIPSEIPIDVSEHFRERVLPHPVLLIRQPLVNYSETIITHRSHVLETWGAYQALLIGSVFALARPEARQGLATALWEQRGQTGPAATSLLTTALTVREAWPLWRSASVRSRRRFIMTFVRRFPSTFNISRALNNQRSAWDFLMSGPFAQFMQQSAAGTR